MNMQITRKPVGQCYRKGAQINRTTGIRGTGIRDIQDSRTIIPYLARPIAGGRSRHVTIRTYTGSVIRLSMLYIIIILHICYYHAMV